jgi:tryptophan 2,3-dioxygenase
MRSTVAPHARPGSRSMHPEAHFQRRRRTMVSDERNAPTEPYTDFSGAMSYGDYLHLDALLAAQHPLTAQHDELLFIIIHQATELWMKLALHELTAARSLIITDSLQPAFKNLARVSRIQAQLIQSWDVLATMTPSDYSSFRGALGHSSGFQSAQYRLIEFALGNKQAAMIAPHRHRTDLTAQLEEALATPSIYDETIRLLARRGMPIAAAVLTRDVREPYRADPSVLAAWTVVYQEPDRHWDLYQLAEELVDLEDWFQQWRFRHVKTVQRIIGFKRGTGGTSGVGYLNKVLEMVFFPELWDVRTNL